MISGFRRQADENCTLLGYWAASSGDFLPKFRDNLSVPSSRVSLLTLEDRELVITSCRRFETTYWSHFKGQEGFLTLEDVEWVVITSYRRFRTTYWSHFTGQVGFLILEDEDWVVVISCRSFGKTYRSHLQRSRGIRDPSR